MHIGARSKGLRPWSLCAAAPELRSTGGSQSLAVEPRIWVFFSLEGLGWKQW